MNRSLETLMKLQWGGTYMQDGYLIACCPSCRGLKDDFAGIGRGHHENCELSAMMKKVVMIDRIIDEEIDTESEISTGIETIT